MTTANLQRFQELWHRKTTQAPLSSTEREEFAVLEAEILQDEATYLAPANARLRSDVNRKASEVSALESLLARAEALLEHPNPSSQDWLRARAEVLQEYRRLHNRKDTELAV
jgi:hypothetical protein